MAARRGTPQTPEDRARPHRIVLRIEGHVLLIDDLTIGEFVEIERDTGVRWSHVNPLVSADQAQAVLAAVLRRTMPTEEAAKRVAAMTFAEALTHVCLEPYDNPDDRPAEYRDGVPVIDPLPGRAATGTTSSS